MGIRGQSFGRLQLLDDSTGQTPRGEAAALLEDLLHAFCPSAEELPPVFADESDADIDSTDRTPHEICKRGLWLGCARWASSVQRACLVM